MNKKGFTLIELLAVIIVLAILVLMALPKVTSMMEKSRVNAFAVEANQIIKSARNAYGNKLLTEEEISSPICYTVAELINLGYLDADNDDITGAVVIDFVNGGNAEDKEVLYTYLSKNGYYIRKNDSIGKNSVINSDVIKNNGSPIFKACTTTCTASAGGISIKCGDTEITGITSSPIEEACEYEINHEWNFDYKGSIDEFEVPCGGYYKLEVWGAQGGSYDFEDLYYGGYGGYATGSIRLTNTNKLYIGVGGKGIHVGNASTGAGGYNGGGAVAYSWRDGNERRSSGGGGTHIALNNNLGELKNYVNNQNDVLIVAGGGGGGHANRVMVTSTSYTGGFGYGGHGGGTKGGQSNGQQYADIVTSPGGDSAQTPSATRGLFGQGGQSTNSSNEGILSGGGGGWYGGSSGWRGGGGGSGHLSSSLQNAHMACYECMASSDTNTTIIHSASETAASDVAKKDNGYAKITYLGSHI